MSTLDLDAARARRREGQRKPPSFTFGGETFKLPPEIPWEVIDAASTEDYSSAVRALLGDAYPAFVQHHPSVDDVRELIEGIGVVYGISLGESSASSSSSKPVSRRSRPISNGSIK